MYFTIEHHLLHKKLIFYWTKNNGSSLAREALRRDSYQAKEAFGYLDDESETPRLINFWISWY